MVRPMKARFLLAFSITLACGLALLHPPLAQASPELRTEGRHFVGRDGRTVILRGVNLAGNSKVLPFRPLANLSQLDPLPHWGLNAIRLLFIWEAFEPRRGQYDFRYLQDMADIVDAAWARGIHSVIDFHQDCFSRFVAGGCGSGFPEWAASARFASRTPGRSCGPAWALDSSLRPKMHGAFRDFYANRNGARDAYLAMARTVAAFLASHPGAIGYDLINEPWAGERTELSPLYEDLARAIREEDPSAILFVEPHVLSVTGLKKSRLAKPRFGNFAYAPHFYDLGVMSFNLWSRAFSATKRVFARLPRKAAAWDVPLFVGEFGAPARARAAGAFMDYQYGMLDDALASGAQWSYTPGWTKAGKDGWNDEDLSIVDDSGQPRANFRPRPFARRLAGTPIRMREIPGGIELAWDNRPALGATEAYLPEAAGPAATPWMESSDPDLRCAPGESDGLWLCSSPNRGPVTVKLGIEASSRRRSNRPPDS